MLPCDERRHYQQVSRRTIRLGWRALHNCQNLVAIACEPLVERLEPWVQRARLVQAAIAEHLFAKSRYTWNIPHFICARGSEGTEGVGVDGVVFSQGRQERVPTS